MPLIFKFFIGDKPYLEKLREYKDWATCPNCGKSYCIDHTKQETISENITTKTKTDDKGNVTDTKRYRVGERKIYWHCKECNKMGDGIVEYEELIS